MRSGGIWATLPLLAMLAAAPARASTVWLAIPEGVEPCSFEQLADALRSRLPDVRVEPGVYDLGPGDVAVAMHRDVEGWSLVVRAAGEHELRRKLPSAGVDCVGLAQTSAFMVQRYLGEVRWTGAQVVIAPVNEKSPEPVAHWQATAELGIAGALTTGSSGLGPALQLDLGARQGHWELGVSLSGEPVQQAGLANNSQALAEISFVPGILQLVEGYRVRLGPTTLRVELMPGVQVTWAWLGSTSADEPAFVVGGRIAWEVTIYRRLFASLRVAGRVIVPQILILKELGGLPAAPYVSGYGAGDASLALGYLFF
jgi:hypothetical protein